MKVYLFSDVPGGGDDITDALDRANVNVIAKEGKMDVSSVGRNIERLMQESAPNLFVFVTDDSVEAGIDLNKMEGVRAAVCSSYEDVTAAKKHGANVIIVQDTCTKKPEIADAMVGANQSFGKMFNVVKNNRKRMDDSEQIDVRRTKKAKSDYDNFDDMEAVEGELHKNRKGIVGKLKDSLGIMD